MSDEYYSYQLNVSGSPEDQKAVFDLLEESDVIGQYLEPCGPSEAPYSCYECPEHEDGDGLRFTFEWDETDQENLLHDIAVRIPNVTLDIFGDCETNGSYGYHKRFHGDMYQESYKVVSMPDLSEDGDVPFSERYAAKNTVQQEKVPPQMSMLCEEYEDDGGIRETYVLAVSEDKEALKQLLRAKVEKDEYGYFKVYGASEDQNAIYTSQYPEDGYGQVSYYILTQDVLDRDQVLAQLNSPEYSSEFPYPDNMRELCLPIMREMIEAEGYANPNPEIALDQILESRSFRAAIQNAWWYDPHHLDENSEAIKTKLSNYLGSIIDERYDEDPKWFETIGAAIPSAYPDNLKDILIASIYDVSKDHHLPVNNAEAQADKFLVTGEFRSLFKTFGSGHLEEGTDRYQAACLQCYDFIKEQNVPDQKRVQTQSRIDALLTDAVQRQEAQTMPSNDHLQKGR